MVSVNKNKTQETLPHAMITFHSAVPSDYPRDLLAFVLSPTEIQVTWEPVPRIEQNGIITQYEVEFNQSTFSEISLSNTTTISGSVLEVILIDLEEVVEYSIRVRAFTNEGPGPYSPIENATTPEAGMLWKSNDLNALII